jgi:hypothetical protein
MNTTLSRVAIAALLFAVSMLAQGPLSVRVRDLGGSAAPTGACESGARYTQTGTVPVLWVCGSGLTWQRQAASGLQTQAKTTTFFNFAWWGDSMTAGSGGTAPPVLFNTSTGLTTYNGGVGGETSTQIRTRMVADTTRAGNTVVIWAGRNNYTDPTTVKADIAAMVASLASPKNYVILGITNGESVNEYAGGALYAIMVQLNADLAALYPDNFIDIRAYLVSQYNPSIPQDVTDFGRDIVPSSLRSDAFHLTTAGNTLVSARVEAFFAARGSGLVSQMDLGRFARALPPVTGTSGFLSVLNGISISHSNGSVKNIYMAGDNQGYLTNGSLRPDTGNTRDFGSLSLPWKDGHFAGFLAVGGQTSTAGVIYAPTTFASLGPVGNGQTFYCSDCTKATPCDSGGTGALAKRLNGAWDCN